MSSLSPSRSGLRVLTLWRSMYLVGRRRPVRMGSWVVEEGRDQDQSCPTCEEGIQQTLFVTLDQLTYIGTSARPVSEDEEC